VKKKRKVMEENETSNEGEKELKDMRKMKQVM